MSDAPSAPTDPVLLDGEDDWIRYRVGNPAFRGETTVSVRGSGAVTVSHEAAGSLERYDGTLSGDRLATLRETLAANDPRAFPDLDRAPEPDEARIRIRGETADGEYARAFWHGDRDRIDGLDALVDAFEEVATHVSDGAVTH